MDCCPKAKKFIKYFELWCWFIIFIQGRQFNSLIIAIFTFTMSSLVLVTNSPALKSGGFCLITDFGGFLLPSLECFYFN